MICLDFKGKLQTFFGVASVPELSIQLTLRYVVLRLGFPTVVLNQTSPPSLTHTLRTLGWSNRDYNRKNVISHRYNIPFPVQ